MSRGELTTGSMKIDKLRMKILEGEIKIPPFQRTFVWKKDQVIDLLDSIYNDFPIGSILLWETIEDLPSVRDIGGFHLPSVDNEYPVNYILDGQQRVTSIFGVFCKELTRDENSNDKIFEVFFDLNDKRFISKDEIISNHSNLPLELLFNNFDFNNIIRDFDRDKNEMAVKLQSIFQNYEIPTITIKKKSKSEVGVIFERINNTGTPLSTLDLMIAWTWKENYHLKEKFEEIYELLENKGFGGIKQKIILQCFGAIIKQTTATKEILDLEPNMVRNQTEKIKKSLELAIDYLSSQFNVLSEDFLPQPQHLVSLTYFFSNNSRVTREQGLAINKWFWRTSFSDRYSAGTDKKMDEDIQFFSEILKDNFSTVEKYSSNVDESFFSEQVFTKSNRYVKAYLLLLAQHKPRDLTNGQYIDIGKTLSHYNRKEYHHIFPRAFLKENYGLENKDINKVSNFCFLPSNSNKKITDRPPSDYFFSEIYQINFEEILSSNLLPLSSNIYEEDDYEAFLIERSKIIYQEMVKLTGED